MPTLAFAFKSYIEVSKSSGANGLSLLQVSELELYAPRLTELISGEL